MSDLAMVKKLKAELAGLKEENFVLRRDLKLVADCLDNYRQRLATIETALNEFRKFGTTDRLSRLRVDVSGPPPHTAILYP